MVGCTQAVGVYQLLKSSEMPPSDYVRTRLANLQSSLGTGQRRDPEVQPSYVAGESMIDGDGAGFESMPTNGKKRSTILPPVGPPQW